MASIQQFEDSERTGERAREAGEQALGPAAIIAAASVGLSWYYYFVRGDRHRGLFVGLWPPTILAFAGYFNQRRMRNQLELLTQPGTTLKNAFDSVLGNR